MNMKYYVLFGIMLLLCSCTHKSHNNKSEGEFLVYSDSALIQHLLENNGVKADFIVDTSLTRLYLEDKENMHISNLWKGGEVKTAAEAYRIAEPYFLAINHGDIELEKPIHINLINDTLWVIYGYPQAVDGTVYFGGEMYMEIQKSNGIILKVILGE